MKRIYAGLLVFSLLLAMTGCGNLADTTNESTKLQGAYDNEILTTKAIDQDKTMITIRTENNVAQSVDLEAILEEAFPEVDIVLVHDGSVSSEYNIRADLLNGTECDLILSRRLNTVDDIASDYLYDLSSEGFVDNYYMSAVDSCATADGQIYYLPGPSDIYGIVYDKTMFEENGWELPGSYSEFVELLSTINDAGLTAKYKDDNGNEQESKVVAFQPTMMYPDMFQIFFNTYNFDEVYQGSDNYNWLSAYQNGEGSMVGHMEPAAKKFKKLVDDGILSLSDWDMQPGTRSSMMYTWHTTTMVVECQNALTYAKTFAEDAGEDGEVHELAMMPFYTSDEDDSDYLYSIPNYYMAINKASTEESDEKKEILLDIYEYLSSAKGQTALINDSSLMSNVQGVGLSDSSFSEAIRNTVEEGRVISTFYLAAGENSKQVEKQLRETAPDMINGDMSVKDWLLAADAVRDDFLAGNLTTEEVYGTVDTTLTRLESAYTVAEMYKDMTDADIGLVLAGAWKLGTNGHFYKGDITDSSLSCVTPDKEASTDEDPYTGKIVTAEMTGEQILDILNYAGSSTDTSINQPYYVAAGLTVDFDPWAGEGERVISCEFPDGTDDTEQTFKVAFFYGSLPGGISAEPENSLDATWQESFLSWLETQGGTLKEPEMTITLSYGKGGSDAD